MKTASLKEHIQGFTLVEILVAVSIIAILSSITFASFSGAKESSRDKERVIDLAQIQLGLRLYAEENGSYPKESDGFSGAGSPGAICDGCTGLINAEIEKYLGTAPEDPRHDGTNYQYYYDGSASCGGSAPKAIIFARTMENSVNSNSGDLVCTSWDSEGGTKDGAYIIILGETPG